MVKILHINTAFETATVFISAGESIVAVEESTSQKAHAAFLEPAINKLCTEAGLGLPDVDAICTVNGPGSYTGLRVGLASAKALCYALGKPLILLNTLEVMAQALQTQYSDKAVAPLFCPMIDARRNEVFTALYDDNLHIINQPAAAVVDEAFLCSYRQKTVVLGGNGSFKAQSLLNSQNFVYINPLFLNPSTLFLCTRAFHKQIFSNIAYSEPFYLKPVYFKN